MVDAAIAEALADCDDRPFLKKPRKVVVEVSIQPVLDGSALKGVDVATGVKLTKPPQAAREQYLRTTFDSAHKTVEAMLPSEHQSALFTESKGGN